MTCILCKLGNSAYHWLWSFGAALYYRFPSRELVVIGVTGTKGKSTVVEMAHAILQEAGLRAASASSVRFRIGEKDVPNMLKMTMPGKGALQKFLCEAADAGCTHAILEVTSEGIRQFRHSFIDFDCAVFTNLAPEHIESHGSFEKYRAEKLKLFARITNNELRIKGTNGTRAVKVAAVNLDDENAEYFLQAGGGEIYGYSIKIPNSLASRDLAQRDKIQNSKFKIVEAQDVSSSNNGVVFSIQDVKFSIPVLGEFNIYNALAAICVGLAYGVPLEVSARALGKFRGVPGRMEVVIREPFRVIVDYAHTPDSLEKVYKTLRNKRQETSGKLICVLGAAGGGRDKWKRPEFGRIAAQHCDEIILTDEDPYDENPASILQEVERGIKNYSLPTTHYSLVLDRREAIRKAIELAHFGDTVIITGKGCEPWMMTRQGRVPWDDRQIVREVNLMK